ncbi:response regulator [Pleurocapsales cyanobacterium LEGE 06147]|nr:response regulator [Pleurocapsales cyanobacterium LEGE 06147]
MQGNLHDINIYSILQLLESEQKTGMLYVETEICSFHLPQKQDWDCINTEINFLPFIKPQSQQRNWFIFFVAGQIIYATDSNNQDILRLKNYLDFYQQDKAREQITDLSGHSTIAPEYFAILMLLQQQLLEPIQVQTIVQNIIKETLFELLILNQKKIIFTSNFFPIPQVTNLRVSSVIRTIKNQIKLWKQFYPYIRSPHQYLVISDRERLRLCLSKQTYQTLSDWTDKKASLLQISRYINSSVVQLAKAIEPYVRKGWIKLSDNERDKSIEFFPKATREKTHIICIDNDVANGNKVEYILKQRGYDLTIVKNSIEALSLILTIKPTLILCNINMPQFSGYELCTMLQHIQICQKTPIIMLADRDNFIDRVKAKLLSATDYLTKPFTKNELLALVEKHLSSINNKDFSTIGSSPVKM